MVILAGQLVREGIYSASLVQTGLTKGLFVQMNQEETVSYSKDIR